MDLILLSEDQIGYKIVKNDIIYYQSGTNLYLYNTLTKESEIILVDIGEFQFDISQEGLILYSCNNNVKILNDDDSVIDIDITQAKFISEDSLEKIYIFIGENIEREKININITDGMIVSISILKY